MLLGRISRLCFVVLVVWPEAKASFVGSFELFRGHNDVFSNSKCSQTGYGGASGQGHDELGGNTYCWNCQKYGANCKDMDCSYCICNRSDIGSTYIRDGFGNGRCVRDEEVLPESVLVPAESFGVMNNNHEQCIRVDRFNDIITAGTCSSLTPETRWIWTQWPKRLMNIKTLQCVEVADNGLSVTMKPCNFNSQKQTLLCSNNNDGIRLIKNWNAKRSRKTVYLKLSSSDDPVLSVIGVKRRDAQKWKRYPTNSGNLCDEITTYIGCYRFFADGSFLRFLSYDEQCIGQKGTCVHKVNISAPIFTENGNCSLNWEGSEYSRHGYFWNSVGDYENHYFDLETTHEDSVKLLKVNISASKNLNGSLIKLNIICHNGKQKKWQRTEEEHCVLLKFKTLPRSEVQTSIAPSTIKSTDAFSNRSNSKSSKAVAISVPIVLLIIIACVAAGVLVIYRRRKGGQPGLTTNEQVQSCGSDVAQNPSTNVYEDPTQTYEQLKVNERGTGDEQPYQGLVGLHSQDKDTSVYDYIDDKNATNPGINGEYSYASNEILPRSFAPSQPLPSAPVVYETLEKTDGSDNPAFEHDKLSDSNGNAPKNEPFNEKCKSPVYQTLEEQEAVKNPKSLDSVEESVDQQSQNPVYQTLENSNAGQDISSETFGNSSAGGDLSGDPIYHVVDNP